MNKESMYKFDNVEDIKKFIIGGKAIFTLESKVTGKWFTYRVKLMKKDDITSPFFVSVLTGNDNESSYAYMGTIFQNEKLTFRLTKNSKIGESAMSYKAFEFFFDLLMKNEVHKDMNVYHQGVCGRCGRKITVPESLVNGLGTECSGLVKKELRKHLNNKTLSYDY